LASENLHKCSKLENNFQLFTTFISFGKVKPLNSHNYGKMRVMLKGFYVTNKQIKIFYRRADHL
jgi:hypothetical protein